LNFGCQVGTKLGVAICCAYPEEAKAITNPKTTNFILHTSLRDLSTINILHKETKFLKKKKARMRLFLAL
jgi:hypothetical protein